MKATAKAPSNIAFIKYWGKKDEMLRIPENASISMNLSNLYTITTVEFSPKLASDEVSIDGKFLDGKGKLRVVLQIDRLRKLSKSKEYAKVVSKNSFPAGTGLSSSASGFAALTHAASQALGLKLSEKELSILARFGSGSASRSIPNGFVEWKTGNTSKESYSYTLYDQNYWDVVDIVLVLSEKQKLVASGKGQESAAENPFFKTRLHQLEKKTHAFKKALKEKNFSDFGVIVESEALELHSIMLTSHPPLMYLFPETIVMMQKVWDLRSKGISCYFTLNTGHNVHIITTSKFVDKVLSQFKPMTDVKEIISNTPSVGSRIVNDHLF